ncbi:hypothetical protein DMN91_000627 [Ooceraea biroi]|uniref:Putative ribonuclease ZC3H12D n=1 Tax=Ooceraea biroi TaxID=2015173 RepID=A0A026W663_OOCBI|nr:NEDD4-binding protein 1 [Ooceraea biroi]EZA51498.1 putative ribonuclease ZC3H12D [Ooceraea biroi]RLU26830.1 hypothetical protein DMN91_000627 [Ooceraea biroi]
MVTMSDDGPSMRTRSKKRRLRSSLAPSYESPLSCLKDSLENLEELTNIVGDLLRQNEKRLTRSTSRNASSSRDSVIIINSDNEDAVKEGASHGVIESTSTDRASTQQRKPQNKILLSLKKRKRPSVILLDNDSSLAQPSSAQKFLNGENIAPSQAEDDVVELWSCIGKVMDKTNTSKSNRSKSKRHNRNVVNKRLNFVIDTKPNMKNLECLKTDAALLAKKRKISKYNSDTSVLPLSESMTQVMEHSKKGRSKRAERRNDNNANSNSACPNVQYTKGQPKTIESYTISENFKSKCSSSQYKLREIIVDGCNVAQMYTNNQQFSEDGIRLVVDYFKSRGHVVKVFLPNHFRRRQFLFLEKLYKEGTVVFTPSRFINGKRITPYDDRYILEYATKCEGIVISSDQYRDLYEEKPEWRDTILNRLLMPTFVGDYIMFPEDPLGKCGPKLETFLRHSK